MRNFTPIKCRLIVISILQNIYNFIIKKFAYEVLTFGIIVDYKILKFFFFEKMALIFKNFAIKAFHRWAKSNKDRSKKSFFKWFRLFIDGPTE